MATPKKQKNSVKIYSTPTCVYCNMAKDFFKAHSIAYEDFNVATDLERRKEMIEKSGQMGVPVIIAEDEIIVGFDERRLSAILGVK